MARNRKNSSAGYLSDSTLKATVIVVFIVSCCVGYVWQKKQIGVLSGILRAKEARLMELRENNDKMRRQYASLMSPVALDARVKELNLGLALPDPSKIWRLNEPVPVDGGLAPAQQQLPQQQWQSLRGQRQEQYAAGRSDLPAIP